MDINFIIYNKYEDIVWTILKKMEIKCENLYDNKNWTGLLRKRVQIECAVWHLDVGLAYPHECRDHEGLDCSSIKKLHELG